MSRRFDAHLCQAQPVERDDDGMPPDEAYGRVTNPERYAVLHDAARAEIDRLCATYDVERIDGLDLDPSTRQGWEGSPSTRLVPAGGGAPLTISLTAFPGVRLRAGHAYRDGFPNCGCDACDEQPDDLIERLTEQIDDIVAGRFAETRWPAWPLR